MRRIFTFLILLCGLPSMAFVVNIGPMGDPAHSPSGAHPSCSELLFKTSGSRSLLGDFREIARLGVSLPFRQLVPNHDQWADTKGSYFEIEYELDIKMAHTRDRHFRDIVETLVEKSLAGDREREVGAFVFSPKEGSEPIVVYFTSSLPDRITMEIHQEAISRFFDEVNRRYPNEVTGLIERLHTHPSHANEPHGASDVLEDVRLDRWLAQSRFFNVQFRSYVIPLNYRGDIYCEFEPRRHRTY